MRKIGLTSRSVLLAAALVLVVGAGDLAYSDGPDVQRLKVRVVVDFSSFDLRDGGAGTGPFYVGGDVFNPRNGQPLGDFQCWGWFFESDRDVVNQEYNIGNRGKIILAGEEDGGLRAIVGGTGKFSGARGDTTFDLSRLSVDGSFLATFRILTDDDDDDVRRRRLDLQRPGVQ